MICAVSAIVMLASCSSVSTFSHMRCVCFSMLPMCITSPLLLMLAVPEM